MLIPYRSSSPLLALPAELRNEIYKYVFTESKRLQHSLIPSPESLSNLNLLYTCQQIHWEASYLAYSHNFSLTNRWHRDDLQTMRHHLGNQPGIAKYWITSLHLVTDWAQSHVDLEGEATYLCSVTDFENFIWNVLDLFEDVEMITLDVPFGASSLVTFASTLKYRIDLTIRADRRTSICSWASDTSGDAWMNWSICEATEDGLILFGRRDRLVRIVCRVPSIAKHT